MIEPEETPAPLCAACGAVLERNLDSCFSCGHVRRGPPLKRGQRISGRYELTGVLGRGGMGTVYRAHDHSLDEDVALKVLSETVEDSADADRRFRAEIRLARKVRHPNVCAIHEYGQLEDLQYIVMELVHGQDLRKYLDSRGRLSMTEALDLAREIGEGLQAIHDAGVIHRDLKLANVMRDGAGRLRLMDFGIAKRAGDMMSTVTGHIVGTPEYMSPEQVQGQPVDARADIYSLGVMTYELLTGRVPFRAETPLGLIMMHVHEPPKLNDDAIPGEVAAILGKALAKKPEDRYESARAFSSALTAARASLDSPVGSALRAGSLSADAAMTSGPAGVPLRGHSARWIGASSGTLVVLGVIGWLITQTREPAGNPQVTKTARSVSVPVPGVGPEEQPAANPSPLLPTPPPPQPTPTGAPRVERSVAPRTAAATFSPSRSPDPTREPPGNAMAFPATPTAALANPASPTTTAPPATPAPTSGPSLQATAPAPPAAPAPTPGPSLQATAPAPVGYLQIRAAPFAQVTVDGNDHGTVSNPEPMALGPGRHVVRFLHPAYQPLQRIITIRPGETVNVFVDLKLDGIAK